MPSVTITLTDTPMGSVSVRSDFTPAIGAPCSLAQSAALEIINRTCKAYGLSALPLIKVDIDAVHRTRDQVVPT